DTGSYDDLRFGRGWEGPGAHYRKVEKIERDPDIRRWIENALYERIARRWIGDAVALYRAVVFNKADTGGAEVTWDQDGGLVLGRDRDPTLQIWTALDDTPVEAGCVELIPGTHTGGLRTPAGGTVPAEVVAPRLAESLLLPATAGEAILIHNHVWHR